MTDPIKTKSGAIFVNSDDAKRWEELEAEILVNGKEFNIFTNAQWTWLQNKIVPLINKARKQL